MSTTDEAELRRRQAAAMEKVNERAGYQVPRRVLPPPDSIPEWVVGFSKADTVAERTGPGSVPKGMPEPYTAEQDGGAR